MPYAFASHFAPTHLEEAIAVYRQRFTPSEQLEQPYVIAAANVIASDTEEDALAQEVIAHRQRVKSMMRMDDRHLTDDELDMLVASPQGQQILDMLRYTAVGTSEQVGDYLTRFANSVQVDELMISNLSPSTEQAHHGLEVLAQAMIQE